jgi:hypothetical protein
VRFGKVNASFEVGCGQGKLEIMSARQAKLLFFGLIVLVTLLFFLHVPSGGFQAQNGPTTPVNNLRVALAGLLLVLLVGRIAASASSSVNSMLVYLFPALLHSPAPSSIGISLRC